MTWVAVGAAAVGAAGSIIGGSKAKKAAKAQAKAQKLAIREQARQFDVARNDMAPWRESGAGALNSLNRLMGIAPVRQQQPSMQLSPETRAQLAAQGINVPDFIPQPEQPMAEEDRYGGFYASPGYQFRMDEGIRSLDRSASARGMLRSGAQGRALTRYGQGVASDEFGNYYNRLAGIAGIGQTAAGTMGGYATQQGVNAGNALINQGNARASGYLSQGQMYGNLAGIGADLFTRLGNQRTTNNVNNALDSYFNKPGNF